MVAVKAAGCHRDDVDSEDGFLGFLRVLGDVQGEGVEPWGSLRIPWED